MSSFLPVSVLFLRNNFLALYFLTKLKLHHNLIVTVASLNIISWIVHIINAYSLCDFYCLSSIPLSTQAYIYIYIYIYTFSFNLTMPCGMWDLSSPTRD